MTDDALLRQVLDELHALRADVDALASRGRLSRDERAMLTALLPDAARIVGAAEFTAGDLLEVPRLAALLEGCTPSQLSWTLGRAAGSTIAGFRIDRIGRDRGGALWRLRREVTAPAIERVR